MSTKKRATLADVARVSGLSVASVSMILNNRPDSRLSEEAHRKVKSAAEALGYRPNIAARSLRTDITHTLGLISDVVATTRYASGLIRGTLEAAEEVGHVVLVAETGGDDAKETTAISAMLDRQVDGLIFASMRAREVSLPVIPDSVSTLLLNATGERSIKNVLPDEHKGGMCAVNTLFEAGHSDRIAVLGSTLLDAKRNPLQSETVEKRFQGIHQAMQEAGMEFLCQERFDHWEPEYGYTAAKKVLARSVKPSAFLCMNDRIAFGAYQAINEHGLKIPDEISLISFDNDELATYLRPGLTTIALPHVEMGRTAVNLLLNESPVTEHLVEMPLITRGSIRNIS